jgi:RND family efflux transporter MFP subunit
LAINATGEVEPRRQSDLAFATGSGRVSEVLVAVGDAVQQNDSLIQLDIRQLQAEVAAAEAAVAVAAADVQALRDGATSAEIAASRSQVAAAQGALVQTQGSVTAADVRAAESSIAEARARLAELEAGPENDELTRARASLDQARANLDQQRAALSAAKVQAERTLEQRANAVREAQSAYSTAYWDLEHVKANETDPRTGRPLTDAQVQDFIAALDSAQRNLNDAETTLSQTRVDYETAVENESTGLVRAEAQVATAEADLDALLQGSDADQIAAARAQLARAEAELSRLTGAQRQGALAAQQANLAAAQAQLDQILADPKASDLARAEARLAQAQAQLEQVQLRFEDATLRAPFAGTVAAIRVAPGEAVTQQSPLTLIDTDRFLIKVTVDEVDIARVQNGQEVEVLIDALGAPVLTGVIQRLEPLPVADSAVTAYQVTIEIQPDERPLKSGMTASAAIIADRRDEALSVPVQAMRSEDGQTVVSLVSTDPDGNTQITTQAVELGLRTSDRVEILSGLDEGQQVLLPNP